MRVENLPSILDLIQHYSKDAPKIHPHQEFNTSSTTAPYITSIIYTLSSHLHFYYP